MYPILRFLAAYFLVAGIPINSLAQTEASKTNSESATPETAFVSPSQYTNAFFGFALPLPHDAALQPYSMTFQGDDHFLFGLKSIKAGIHTFGGGPDIRVTVFTVTANLVNNASEEMVRQAASGRKGYTVVPIEIGGKKFFKGELHEKVSEGKMRSLIFATFFNGYVLKFDVESFDGKLTDQFQHSIEAMTFFEPSDAAKMAGTESRRYVREPQNTNRVSTASNNRMGQLNPGVVSGNTYTNDVLGFTYEFPAGWAVNDKATQDKTMERGHQLAWGDSPSAAREHTLFEQCSRTLLFITKYPEGTAAEEMNPMIVVIAADPSCFSGAHLPASVEDREGMKLAAQGIVKSFAGTPFMGKGEQTVHVITVQGHMMLDISGSFSIDRPGQSAPLTVFTALDFTETKGYQVVWGYMSGSSAGLEELKKSPVTFQVP